MLDTRLPPAGLLDRESKRDALDRLVAGVRAGQERCPGPSRRGWSRHDRPVATPVGDRGAMPDRSSGRGVESEMELAFAGLHAVCGTMLGRLGHLPSPQRDALSRAFGLSAAIAGS